MCSLLSSQAQVLYEQLGSFIVLWQYRKIENKVFLQTSSKEYSLTYYLVIYKIILLLGKVTSISSFISHSYKTSYTLLQRVQQFFWGENRPLSLSGYRTSQTASFLLLHFFFVPLILLLDMKKQKKKKSIPQGCGVIRYFDFGYYFVFWISLLF